MKNPHIVFIVLDTLRDDYGNIIRESLSELGFISYNKVITPSPWTLPAHASIFSGLYPLLHGAHETKDRKNFQVKFNGPNSLLSYLIEQEYETYLLSANMFVRPEFGFSQFEKFWDIYPSQPSSILTKKERNIVFKTWVECNSSKLRLIKRLAGSGRYKLLLKLPFNFLWIRIQHYYRRYFRKWPIEKGSKKAVNILRGLNFKEPTFVFLNLMEVHHPLFLNPPISFYLNFKEKGIDEKLLNLWRQKY
ncbi:hypothetical protein PAP_09920 [Palaeococcus pacificus DY20341]|uniref:Sulfatase N-terminal domain-containing protein n=1 Tax=Palaeococcus pacificus DY20341 TaxID=1343739 RepID=A0A075M0Q8_9EURY|nr:hypothetical protein PAP_09920 [Palaeococcus pacificus DY20341]